VTLERWIGTERAANLRRAKVRAIMRAGRVPALRTMSTRSMRRTFDGLADNWNAIRDDPVYLEAFNRAIDELPSRIPGWSGQPKRVLDVGCGTGLATRELTARFPDADVLGIDLAPEMVMRAGSEVLGARFEVADAFNLKYDDASFDLIVALDGVFDAHELARVCDRGGAIAIVYSKGGSIPVSRPLPALTSQFEQDGLTVATATDGPWILWAHR
jgi:SAM-dependent methyltransferase